MDPNETLRELREWASDTVDGVNEPKICVEYAQVLFEDLDEWLSKGGFLPEAWCKP